MLRCLSLSMTKLYILWSQKWMFQKQAASSDFSANRKPTFQALRSRISFQRASYLRIDSWLAILQEDNILSKCSHCIRRRIWRWFFSCAKFSSKLISDSCKSPPSPHDGHASQLTPQLEALKQTPIHFLLFLSSRSSLSLSARSLSLQHQTEPIWHAERLQYLQRQIMHMQSVQTHTRAHALARAHKTKKNVIEEQRKWLVTDTWIAQRDYWQCAFVFRSCVL